MSFTHHRRPRPFMLDLFCCAGGAGKGYWQAGFDVLGIDIDPQPRYPLAFVRGDALEVLRELHHTGRYRGREVEFVHASPPCQAHSDLQKQSKRHYRDFIPDVRWRLQEWGGPYVIENVEGAPLIDPIRLCGASPEFPELRVIRHRLFESNLELQGTVCPEPHPLCFTHDKRKAHYGRLDQNTSYVQVTGGGNCTVANKRAAMGTPWMTGRECNEAIPPAFTHYLGRQVLAQLDNRLEMAA